MTLFVASIAADTAEEIKTSAERAWAAGADAVELRIDTFDDDPARLASYLQSSIARTWIVTCRSAEEGGYFRGDTKDRVSLLLAVSRGTDAYVDFEFADWRRSSNIRQKVTLASTTPDGERRRLILSTHDFRRFPPDLDAKIDEMLAVPDRPVVKAACHAAHINDTFPALDLTRRHGGRAVVIAMGEDGLWTRVLAGKLGGFATYCALEADDATAPGQVTLADMVNLYRRAKIDPSTRVFGVLGDPVAHSMSPLLFNRWFADAGINAVYLPLRVRRGDGMLAAFLNDCVQRPWLDVGGFSVTIPHKSAAQQWVAEGAGSMAQWIGAVNTIAFWPDAVHGHNTDCPAAVSSVLAALGCSPPDCGGMPVCVLGAGGVARAVVHGLYELGCEITLFGRSHEKTRTVASKYGARAAAWDDRIGGAGELLVNCTNVGMWPAVDDSPMPKDALARYRLVFDTIYSPPQTKLLADAAAVGCSTLSGLDMFIRQAVRQFEIWTGITPDVRTARDLAFNTLQTRAGERP
ncbi:MAG: type I 3-dehydroquinate dehydratase [Phycisphaerae bacterium]|jgi:3-dehydroquinate dehydratase/shikimate dehydrogenase